MEIQDINSTEGNFSTIFSSDWIRLKLKDGRRLDISENGEIIKVLASSQISIIPKAANTIDLKIGRD